MTKRPTGEPPHTELPAGWTWHQATTAEGNRHVAVWREFRNATPFEYACAMALPLDWLRAEDAVARVRALRMARRERPDLAEAVWQRCVRLVYPTLSEQERQDAKEIRRAIAVLQPSRGVEAVAYAPPVRRGPGRPAWTEALFLKRWHEAKSKAAPSDRLADIAAVFRARDGKVGGIGVHSLRRLLRRFTN